MQALMLRLLTLEGWRWCRCHLLPCRCDIDGKKALCRCGGKGVIINKCDTAHLVLTTKVDSGIMSVVDTYKSVVHRCHPQTAVAVGDYVVNLVHPEAFRRVDACNVIAIAI